MAIAVFLRRRLAPVQAGARTAVFLLRVLPMLPSRPMDWVTRAPVVRRVTYPTTTGFAEGDLYSPPDGRRVPGIVVCLGVVPFGVDHPQVARLGEALARAGFAALLYWSPAMRDRRLDPVDARSIALAYQWLIERPYVDETRSGLLGTCVGGSFALMAATEPSVRDRVAFVAAFAPYASMWTFVRDVASASRVRGSAREHWEVDPLTRDVFVRTVTEALAQEERDLVRAAVEEGAGVLDPAALSEAAGAVLALLRAGDLDSADAAMQALPTALREQFAALSPLATVHDLHARRIVVGHDRDDHVIPVSESRQLAEALAGRRGVHYTEFAFFQHATPRRLPVVPLARELWRFAAYVYPIFRQAAG